jgi:TonB family protein
MSERKPCIRCNRGIDAWAKICPFCNQDQSEPVPAVAAAPDAVAAYRPPDEENFWKRKLAMVGAAVLLLFVSFAVGTIINSDDAPKNAPEPVAQRPAEGSVLSGKRADTQLVPMNEPMAQPITSAPAATSDGNIPNEYQRHDATAVSSVEYQQMAARAQAEKKAPRAMVDPRTLTGRAYAQAPPRRRTFAAQTAATPATPPRVASTHPVAEYQPVPNIRIRESRTVRLDLMVGADGRVQDVSIHGVVPGYTREILSAVQQWRYKPATVNGNPVPAPVTVDISFKGNE